MGGLTRTDTEGLAKIDSVSMRVQLHGLDGLGKENICYALGRHDGIDDLQFVKWAVAFA